MRKALSRNPNMVLMLLAGYFLLAMVVRVLRSGALEVDETQQAFVSQFLMMGYGAQPPFYNWLQHGLAEVLGMSIATLTLLKNTVLFLFCLFFAFTARILTKDRSVSDLAVLGTLTLSPIFLLSQRDLAHTVVALFAASLFLYAVFRTLTKPSLAGYVLTGVAVGIGVISKYNFIVLPIAALIAILPEKDLRARLFDWRVLVSILLAGIIVAPHALWVLQNLGAATAQTLGEMKDDNDSRHIPDALEGVLDFVLTTIKAGAPTIAIFAIIFYRDVGRIIKAGDQWTRVIGRMLVACLAIVLVIVLFIGATHMRQKWLVVYMILLPLYLSLKIHAAGLDTTRKIAPMLWIVGALTIGSLAILLSRGLVNPLFNRYSLIHIPYAGFSRAIERDGFGKPQFVIASDVLVGGNMKIQFPDATVFASQRPDQIMPSHWPPGATVLVVGTTVDGKLPEDNAQGLQMLATGAGLPPADNIRRAEIPYPGGGTRRHDFSYSWIRIAQP